MGYENANDNQTLDDVVNNLDDQQVTNEEKVMAEGEHQDDQFDWNALPKPVKERIGKQQHRLKKVQRENEELKRVLTAQQQSRPQNHYQNSNAEYAQQDAVPDIETMLESVAERVIERKAIQQKQNHLHQDRQRFESQLEQAALKYDDFEEAREMVNEHEAILAGAQLSPYGNGPDVIRYLHKNAEEFERISRLPPLEQTRAVLKLGTDLAMRGKKVTNAPAPLTRDRGAKGGTTVSADSISSIKAHIRKQYESKYSGS